MPLVGGGWLPLAFFGLGLTWLGAAAIGLALHPAWLRLPHFHPALVGTAHLWLPGGLGAICIGACYQMAPVILGTPLRARRGAVWWHLALHGVGLTALAVAFFRGSYGFAAIAGTAVALGTALLHGTLARTFCRSSRRDAAAWSLPIATGWLALTACSGAVLAWNRHTPFLPADVLGLLRAHAHAGVVGFFGGLLQGVTFQLVPMFTMAEVRRPRLALAGLLTAQLGLVILIVGLAGAGPGVTRGGAAILALGLGLSAAALRATLASRRRRRWEYPVLNFLGGLALGAVATGGGLVLVFAGGTDELRLRAALAYGIVVIGGVLPLTILGMLGKILPFLVWMKAYGPKVGRQAVPQTHQLGRPKREAAWGLGHTAAIALLATGILADAPGWIGAATLLLGVSLSIYIFNTVHILSHLWRPITRQPDPLSRFSPHDLARTP